MGANLRAVAMLGGTFDPIHIGHLRSAVELRELFGFEQIRLVPAHLPPHRGAPGVDSAQRLRMVELAIADEPGLSVDNRELKRAGPSFTIDTLAELRAELGVNCSLSVIMGADAFAGLDSWRRWKELLGFAHIVVMARPEAELPRQGAVAELLRAHKMEPAMLRTQPAGGIVCVALTPLPISATAVRALIAADHSPRYLLPDAVWSYIREHRLYRNPASKQSLS